MTTHIEREHDQKKPKFIVLEKSIIDNVDINNNNRTLLVGQSFSGETYLMLKFLSRIPNEVFYLITKSPPEQYSNTKIEIKGIGDEIKPLSEYENGIIAFNDVLGSSNSRLIDQFFIRGRHNNLDIYYLSQFYFDLPKRTKRNNSNKIILINQTLKIIEYVYRDVGGYDMGNDKFKQLCKKAWEGEYKYLCIDRSKKRDQGRYCNCNESKKKNIYRSNTSDETFLKTYDSYSHKYSYMCNFKLHIHIFCEQSHSHSFKCYIQLKIEKVWKN